MLMLLNENKLLYYTLAFRKRLKFCAFKQY